MIEFEDIKMVLESLPYDFPEIKESSRLVEDLGLDEEDVDDVFNFLSMHLEVEFPEDDAFYRFAAHLPLSNLVSVCNEEREDPFL